MARMRIPGTWGQTLKLASRLAADALWPLRCVLCDAPGDALCASCARSLAFIDHATACPRCGAPFGMRQCTECNSFSLQCAGYDAYPLKAATSAVLYDQATAQLVRTCKDADELRLADWMAFFIASALPPSWIACIQAVSFVPSSRAARASRGFDHAQRLAQRVADFLGLPCAQLLAPPRTADQRALTRAQRIDNLAGSMQALQAPMPRGVVLVDDVYTTGATLFAASEAIRAAGVAQAFGATFARVY